MESDDIRLKPNVGGARKIARKLHKDASVREVPVSLDKIIRYLKPQYDLDVVKYPLGAKISGLLVVVEGQPTIGFNSDEAWVRRRFTIAHEIGHLLMGHACRFGALDNAEAEAHQFAAELLIPLAFIRKDYKRCPDLEQLAKKYNVSKEALCRHLMECRIL